jgi:hypothetical protein
MDYILFRIKQKTAARIRQRAVLTGVKEQWALYPSKQSLPAVSCGRRVETAPNVRRIVISSKKT